MRCCAGRGCSAPGGGGESHLPRQTWGPAQERQAQRPLKPAPDTGHPMTPIDTPRPRPGSPSPPTVEELQPRENLLNAKLGEPEPRPHPKPHRPRPSGPPPSLAPKMMLAAQGEDLGSRALHMQEPAFTPGPCLSSLLSTSSVALVTSAPQTTGPQQSHSTRSWD